MTQTAVKAQRSKSRAGVSVNSSSQRGPSATEAPRGLRFERAYTTPGAHPFDTVEWELRDALITNERGEKIFEQRGVEVPKSWSQTATNVVVSKYFPASWGLRSASAACAS